MSKHKDDYSLSADDVMQIVGSNIPIVQSSSYSKYNTIDELMKDQDKVLLLYEDSRQPGAIRGHWCCVYKFSDNDLAFFDSYGEMPDDQLKHIPEQYRMQYNMMHRWLAKLMANSNYNLHFNPYGLQGKTTETCGRWCGLAMREQVDPEFFVDKILDIAELEGFTKPKDLDNLVIDITNDYLNSNF